MYYCRFLLLTIVKVHPKVYLSRLKQTCSTPPPHFVKDFSHGPVFRPYESDLGLQGKLWGGLKCSRECLDCCHSGKDTTIKLSSEVTHRSVRQDQPWTWYELTNKHTNSDSHYFSCAGIYVHIIVLKHVYSRWGKKNLRLLHAPITSRSFLLLTTFKWHRGASDKASSVSGRNWCQEITGCLHTQTDSSPNLTHSHIECSACSRCGACHPSTPQLPTK